MADWQVKDIVTVIASGVAAVAGVWNLIRSFREDNDRIALHFGDPHGAYESFNGVLVENRSRHAINLLDYGLVHCDRRLESIRLFGDSCQWNEYYVRTRGDQWGLAPFHTFAASMRSDSSSSILVHTRQQRANGDQDLRSSVASLPGADTSSVYAISLAKWARDGSLHSYPDPPLLAHAAYAPAA